MSTYNTETKQSWWDSAKRILLYIALIAVAIWFFNIATQARSLAQSNAELVNVPIYQLTVVPGGPVRFEDAFNDALELWAEQTGNNAVEMPELEAADYLWMTLVVRNIGDSDANDLEIEMNTTAPIRQLFLAAPGWRNESEIVFEQDALTASASLESLGKDDEALLFIAMNPRALEMPYTEESHRLWARNFEVYFEEAHAESELAEALLYGHGYVIPTEEEATEES
jgi:hypothetical protein